MDITSLLQHPKWRHALYLNERFEQFVQQDKKVDPPQEDTKTQEWLEKYNDHHELFEKRINAEGMDMEAFRRVVNLTDASEMKYDYAQYEWYQELVSIFTDDQQYDIEYYLNLKEEEIPFFELLVPFMNRTIRVMEEGLQGEEEWIGQRRVIGLVLKNVMDKLFQHYIKTLIYELNKSRLNQELKGDHAEQRYRSFVENKIKRPEDILQMLLEYPVMARMMAESVKRINYNMLMVLKRLISDRNDIENEFGVKLDKLQDIHIMGDSHNGGNTVLRLEFNQDIKLIYKPRSLAIDKGFASLLHWFNQKGMNLPFKTIKSLDKGDYGWQEYIPHEACEDREGVARFYERQGQYLAILYVVNATDMHMENILAHGEHPFFVDLESLFHNQAFTHFDDEDAYSALEKTSFILNNSVLKTSMLPALDANSLYHSDLSGLAGDVDQILNTYEVHDKNTDHMRIIRSKINIKKPYHLPFHNEEMITPKDHMSSVKKGFTNAYNLMAEHRQELIQYIDKVFRGCVVRTIIRPTISYFTLLEASSHPKYLRDGLDKTLLLDHMWMAFRSTPDFEDPDRELATVCECYDLSRGDIPLFKAVIGEKYLLHHEKHLKIKGAYSKDILSSTAKKMMRMDEEDLLLQWEFIERTVRTKYLLAETHTVEKSQQSVNVQRLNLDRDSTNLREECLQEAVRLGEYIKEIAIFGEDRNSISWISMGMDAEEKLIYKSSELGLYNGVTGIAYFYIYLAKETGNQEYAHIADLCINTAYEMIENKMDQNISVFTGYGSLLHLLVHKAYLFQEPELLEKAEKLLDILESMIEKDDRLDIIAGSAGTLMTFIDFYQHFHHERALELAKKCGEHLLSQSKNMQNGIAWITSSVNRTPLSGIAHGSAGICLSLAKLYSVTGEHKYLQACLDGIQYENTLHSADENNWKDLRFTDGGTPDDQYSMYWCNGAPGIGIARVGISRYCESNVIIDDIQKAVEKTLQDGFTEVSYSLCHGDLGNLELLMLASESLKDDKLQDYVYSMTQYVLENVKQNNMHWKCGIPGRHQIPGLMLGLAGIGYQLLRLYNHELPSILLLDGPGNVRDHSNMILAEEHYNV